MYFSAAGSEGSVWIRHCFGLGDDDLRTVASQTQFKSAVEETNKRAAA